MKRAGPNVGFQGTLLEQVLPGELTQTPSSRNQLSSASPASRERSEASASRARKAFSLDCNTQRRLLGIERSLQQETFHDHSAAVIIATERHLGRNGRRLGQGARPAGLVDRVLEDRVPVTLSGKAGHVDLAARLHLGGSIVFTYTAAFSPWTYMPRPAAAWVTVPWIRTRSDTECMASNRIKDAIGLTGSVKASPGNGPTTWKSSSAAVASHIPRNWLLLLRIAVNTPRTRTVAPTSFVGNFSVCGWRKAAAVTRPAGETTVTATDSTGALEKASAGHLSDDPGDLDPLVLVAGIGELHDGWLERFRQRRPAEHLHDHRGILFAAHRRREPPEAGPSFDLDEHSLGESRPFRPREMLGRDVNSAAFILYEHQRHVRIIQGDDAAKADRIPAAGLFRRKLPNRADRG